jgi:hypothetical protein
VTQDETKLGDIMRKDCVLRFKRKGRVAAAASIFRDLESPTIVVAASHRLEESTSIGYSRSASGK